MPIYEGVATTTFTDDGRVQVRGGPELKASQAYPIVFGRGIAAVYHSHKAEIQVLQHQQQLP